MYLGVQNGTSISIENIDFQSELENENDKSGTAIYINNRTSSEYRFPTLDSINLNKLSFHGFNDKYVIAVDADPGGKHNPFDRISNFNIKNVDFIGNSTENSLLSIYRVQNAVIEDLHIKDNTSNDSGFFLDGGTDNSSLFLANSEFIGNTTQGATLALQQFQTLLLSDSSFINNHNTSTNTSNKKGFGGVLSLSSDGGTNVGEDPKKGMPSIKNC